MGEELKHLIKKIQDEGVAAAEQKAKSIEATANKRAETILEKAKTEADRIIANAREEVAKTQQGGEVALKQAGRDLMISLRGEIDEMLSRLIKMRVGEALSAKNLAAIINSLVQAQASRDETADLEVFLNQKDLDVLTESFAGELKEAVKKGVRLKSSDRIRAGLSISYDRGESRFDFTDESLAEYLGARLKPRLAELLKESAEKK